MSSNKVVYTPQRESMLVHFGGLGFWRRLWEQRRLVRGLTVRRVQERFRGSVLGAAWVFLLPVMMLAVYAFAFVIVLGNPAESGAVKLERTFSIFCGLIVYGLFSETVSRSSTCVLSQPQFVKRVVFPLHTLPVIAFGEVLVLQLASVLILLVGIGVGLGRAYIEWLVLPLPFIALSLLAVGVGWAVAAIGVFVRDLAQVIGVVLQMLFFLMPICYPMEVLPAWSQDWMMLNPLVVIMEQVRDIALRGVLPSAGGVAYATVIGLVVAQLGHGIFASRRSRFADVL